MAEAVKNLISRATGSTTLPTTPLGRNGPRVTRMGIGLMGLSAFYGTKKPDAERLAFLDNLYASGELFWDTADMYMDNEDLIGQWFKLNPGKRDDIFLATKFANRVSADGSRFIDSSPSYCREACETSLKRLGIPTIDLYYAHRLDGKTPVEKTIEEMVKLKNEGKIRHLGISECSADSLRRAYKVHPIAAVQIEYSPWALDIETPEIDLLKACRELGVAVVSYSPIGRGMMSGKYRSPDDFEEGDFRRMSPRFSKENFPKNLELVDKIVAIAEKKGVTGTQLTLAWLMRQGPDVIPIPGTTSQERLKENLGALKVTLTDEENREIRKVAEAAEVTGGRYPEMFGDMRLFADTPPLNA